MAARLRSLRKKYGWTIEALAQQTGLTKSYLSKVERGLSVPSIAVALKLAHAFKIDVEQLFSDEAGERASYTVVRAGERTPIARSGKASKPAYEGIATQLSHKRLLPFMMYPPPDFATSEFKEHAGEELMFVHKGEVEVMLAGHSVLLGVGDSLYFDAQIPHRLRSTGGEQAQVLVVVHDAQAEADRG
ncbi:transcriptional regulator, XRE family with cupin sensor [Lysobacter sp. yr284]|uniref:helix-turn-helix domain-containing protein n=1 Tax=Lysobacter TaxID=68 RepID=UPI000897520F|nr:helix-turn-helix domain-containing protein [Lysobacter sp. yr284]SDY35718.1 transcriptional regulator, XRE family with cupin sensor [Lysobacter sp. yr284]